MHVLQFFAVLLLGLGAEALTSNVTVESCPELGTEFSSCVLNKDVYDACIFNLAFFSSTQSSCTNTVMRVASGNQNLTIIGSANTQVCATDLLLPPLLLSFLSRLL